MRGATTTCRTLAIWHGRPKIADDRSQSTCILRIPAGLSFTGGWAAPKTLDGPGSDSFGKSHCSFDKLMCLQQGGADL